MVASDRALRRMIARLPELPPADLDAILDSFDERRRTRVRALLAELDSPGPTASDARGRDRIDPSAFPPGLSLWLLERLGVPPEEGAASVHAGAMTPHAALALRACAADLGPLPLDPPQRPSPWKALWRGIGTIGARIRSV